ncbi:MAG: hypothetical protein AB9866_21585 [Syntrophobacteraceae bacterium]
MDVGNWNHSSYARFGYGREITTIPHYTAEDVMAMHPDELLKRFRYTTQIEKELFEYTPFGQSMILIPHMNTQDGTARHRRIEEIQRRLQCTWKTADRINAAMKKLDADDALVEKFINRCLFIKEPRENEDFFPEAKTKHQFLQALENLASEMDAFQLERPPEYEDQTLFGDTRSYYEAFLDTGLPEQKDNRELDGSFSEWPLNRQADPKYEYLPLVDETGRVEDDHASLATCELIGYHPVDSSDKDFEIPTFFNGNRAVLDIVEEFEGQPGKDWIQSQSLPFRSLISTVRKCKDYGVLSQIARKVKETTWETFTAEASGENLSSREIKAVTAIVKGYIKPCRADGEPNGAIRFRYRINQESLDRVIEFAATTIPPMTRKQSSVFWTYRNIVRAAMHMAPVKLTEIKPQGQTLLKRIFESPSIGKLKFLGANMIQFQANKIRGNKLTPPEWSSIWGAYREKKEELTAH